KNARDARQIAGCDAGGSECQLERRQLLPVLADTLREKHLLGHESDHAHTPCRRQCMVNTPFPTVKEPTSHQTRIMVRSPNNDSGSGARKRARHPRNHSARHAYGGGGAAGGGGKAPPGGFWP